MTTYAKRLARERSAARVAFRAHWDAAPTSVRAEGAAWYPTAWEHARRLAAEHGITAPTVAGIIAALSPRVQWATNLTDTGTLLAGAAHVDDVRELGLSAFPGQAGKACAILAGAEPLDVLRGPKERAFYRAIVGVANAAVVDTWIARVASGGRVEHVRSPAHYRALASALQDGASEQGVAVRDYQASVWIQARGAAA